MASILRCFALPLLATPFLLAQAIQIRTEDLPPAMVGAGYHERIEASVDGRCPGSDIFLKAIGNLPRGLELRGQDLTGAARETGVFRFRIRAANTCAAVERRFQLAVTGKPILKVYPEALMFQVRAGHDAPPPESVTVSASFPDLPYTVSTDAAWMILKPRSGVTPPAYSGLAADMVQVEVSTRNLAAGIYRGTIRCSTWSGANAPEVAVTLIVLP
jgi:hypothetical protein